MEVGGEGVLSVGSSGRVQEEKGEAIKNFAIVSSSCKKNTKTSKNATSSVVRLGCSVFQ